MTSSSRNLSPKKRSLIIEAELLKDIEFSRIKLQPTKVKRPRKFDAHEVEKSFSDDENQRRERKFESIRVILLACTHWPFIAGIILAILGFFLFPKEFTSLKDLISDITIFGHSIKSPHPSIVAIFLSVVMMVSCFYRLLATIDRANIFGNREESK